MKQEWTINPVIEVLAIHLGLDPTASDQWALAMGDYLDHDVTEEDIEPVYWKARITYIEFLEWLRTSSYRFPHSIDEANKRLSQWLNAVD